MRPNAEQGAQRFSRAHLAKHQGQPLRGLSYKMGSEPLVFRDLCDPSVSLVAWSRGVPAPVQSSLQEWATGVRGEFETTICTRNYSLQAAYQGMDPVTRDWLTVDIAFLVGLFSIVAKTEELKLSFGAIHSDRCRKFHRDNLRYRLVCTYAGPGTEWVPAESVNQGVLQRPPLCFEEANRMIVKEQGAIQRASVGDVLMMKGELHPHAAGVVHRSPPIEQVGVSRVALILSTLDDKS